jgi:hypothetical protein
MYSRIRIAYEEQDRGYEEAHGYGILCLDKLTRVLGIWNIDQKEQKSKDKRGNYRYCKRQLNIEYHTGKA